MHQHTHRDREYVDGSNNDKKKREKKIPFQIAHENTKCIFFSFSFALLIFLFTFNYYRVANIHINTGKIDI